MTPRPALTRFVLLLTALLPLAAWAASPKAAAGVSAPVAGVDYVVIEGGQPYVPAKGRIEVVEVFGYACPHCAHFEPLVVKWKARQRADVKFTPVAAAFNASWVPFAQAFYTAQSMGLAERAHGAVFNAVHLDGSLPLGATAQELADFYGKYGVRPALFAAAMASPATEARIRRAEAFMIRSGVTGTPSIIVNGKYLVLGRTFQDMLRITDELVARERAAKRH